MWLKEFLEKHIINKKETKKIKIKYEEAKKQHCKNFEKGNNGFCKHYMGCKVDLTSCANECEAGGLGESRKDNKSTTTEHT